MEITTNKIFNMDCLAGMTGIGSGTIDMILCDLPYGVTDCLWDKIIPLPQLWAEYERVIKPNGAIVLPLHLRKGSGFNRHCIHRDPSS